MKRFAIALVLLLVLIVGAGSVLAQNGYAIVNEGQVNVRTGPGIQYPIMRQVYFGEIYPVIDRSPTGNWLLLDLGDTRGWIFRLLTTSQLPAASAGVDTSAGQGGGGEAAPASAVRTDLAQTLTMDEFNRTVGVLGSLRLRQGPGQNYRILTVIPDGSRLNPLARTLSGTWIYVEYQGMEGWVSFRYVAAPPALDLSLLPVRQ